MPHLLSTLARPLVLLASALIVACHSPGTPNPPDPSPEAFQNPQRIFIQGYDGDAMEPFVSRDGRYLFFNNRNEAADNTNLYWAERIDDLHFRYRGEIRGVNTAALEAVASMDRDGNFYFVSNRSYDRTTSTLYRARFADGALAGIELVPGVSLARPGIVNFDAEISADGNTLYFVESEFSWLGRPKSARILFARRDGAVFVRDPASQRVMASLNADGLNYAPATSTSELEIFFTRAGEQGPAIYTARRAAKSEPFGEIRRVAAVDGFVEAPSLSPDERSLYYHKRENGRFVIYAVTRP